MSTLRTEPGGVVVEELAPGAIEALLDREAHALLNMSGDEFARKWEAGDFMTADDPRITDLAILLP